MFERMPVAEMPVVTRFDLVRQVVGGWLFHLSNLIIGHGMSEGDYLRRCAACIEAAKVDHAEDYRCISRDGYLCGCCSD